MIVKPKGRKKGVAVVVKRKEKPKVTPSQPVNPYAGVETRLCISYVHLSHASVEMPYSFKGMDQLRDFCSGYKIFASLDMCWSFQQYTIAKSCRHLFAFIDSLGRKFQPIRLMFGHKNGSAFTQRRHEEIFADFVFREQFLSNFSKEFYHWLVVGYNEAQRVRV